MARRTMVAFIGAFVAGALLAGACGGGSSKDDGAPGQRVTDPAKVPSSTPIGNTLTYQIRNDVIIAPDGSDAPVSSGSTPVSGSKSYTVKPGDNCGAIAAEFGITVAELLKANRTIDENCSNLRPGDVLKIPGGSTGGTTGGGATAGTPTPKPSGKEYTVQSGDTCNAIAQSYGVDLQKLIALNNLDPECLNLQVGQKIKIP
ncbi:MAG: LysM peptidoglycan-binding domain-containing protein [Dehalococcoidia bacterium]|nr:LysM peptidoglycan-binding domain-containing protein [Dehalococcoidia bacterium]MCL4232040.1 LysM peptidoglycan-binding domain-containing protein [Dehalococcoidia bacterium]NUQ54330.1 LysM peptidoglycan-binding domain-containing protein [Dehalococcoidia bacterium]